MRDYNVIFSVTVAMLSKHPRWQRPVIVLIYFRTLKKTTKTAVSLLNPLLDIRDKSAASVHQERWNENGHEWSGQWLVLHTPRSDEMVADILLYWNVRLKGGLDWKKTVARGHGYECDASQM